jgi:hypothetical protein
MEAEALEMARLYARIGDPAVRKAVRDLLHAMVESSAKEGHAILAFAPRPLRGQD